MSEFTNSNLSNITSQQEQEAKLNRLIKVYEFYDSITLLDLNGNVIAKSPGQVSPSLRDQAYFQQVLKTNQPVISEPEISKSTGELDIYFAGPVKDTVTGKTIAVIRTRMPVKSIDEVIKNFGNNGNQYYLFDSYKKYFVASEEKNKVGEDVLQDFPNFAHLQVREKVTSQVMADAENHQKLVAYAPLGKLDGLPELNWGVLISTDTAIAFAPQRQLLLTLVIGTGITALLVSAIAAYLANRATRPILAATDALEKLGQGKLDTRIAVAGEDEFGVLGSNINLVADRLQNLAHSQADEAERARLVKDINARVGQFLHSEEILDMPVEEIRLVLKTDRVIVYGFNDNWKGTVIAESVAESWPRALGAKIDDPCFAIRYVERYRQGRVQATENIYEAGLTKCHIKQLEQFAVKANLVAPIIRGDQLLGLLIAHQCNSPRVWQQDDIDLFAQLATQVAFALNRKYFLEQREAGGQ